MRISLLDSLSLTWHFSKLNQGEFKWWSPPNSLSRYRTWVQNRAQYETRVKITLFQDVTLFTQRKCPCSVKLISIYEHVTEWEWVCHWTNNPAQFTSDDSTYHVIFSKGGKQQPSRRPRSSSCRPRRLFQWRSKPVNRVSKQFRGYFYHGFLYTISLNCLSN